MVQEQLLLRTDRDPYGVDNGVYVRKINFLKGEKVIDIHSHLPGGTKGGAGNDFNLAKPQRKNVVYMKDNRVSTDKKGMIYEYTKMQVGKFLFVYMMLQIYCNI